MTDVNWLEDGGDGDDVAGLQRDMAAVTRVLLGIPEASTPRGFVLDLPDLPEASPWEGAFSSTAGVPAAPVEELVVTPVVTPVGVATPVVEPEPVLAHIDPLDPLGLSAVPPLVEVEPLVAVPAPPPLAPVAEVEPLVPEPVLDRPAISSWDSLGVAEPQATPTSQHRGEAPARLEGREAAAVLAELGFLDD